MLEDVEGAISRARKAGLKLIVTIGNPTQPLERVAQIAEKYDEVWFSAGVHPHDAIRWNSKVEKSLDNFLRHEKAVMIGEIGLDFYRMNSPREVQIEVFKKQLDMAKEMNMPVSVHIRDAYDEAYRILSGYKDLSGKVILHCYSSGTLDAERFLGLGCYISFAGTLTYPRADQLREVASKLPVDRMLVETDCPCLSPQPVRGKKNEPAYVTYVLNEIVRLRKIPFERLSVQVYKNLVEILGEKVR